MIIYKRKIFESASKERNYKVKINLQKFIIKGGFPVFLLKNYNSWYLYWFIANYRQSLLNKIIKCLEKNNLVS